VAIAAPSLVHQKKRLIPRPIFRFPEYWHLLSLDAPTVAALWAFSFARAVGVRLPFGALFLLALGTWLVYVADRILDGLRPAGAGRLRARHLFYVRHRNVFLVAGSTGSALILWLVITHMRPVTRREDLMFFVFALAYFVLIHTFGKRAEHWFPKEMAVGVLFATATAVPAWSRIDHHTQLIPYIALFALLCWLNCVAIEKWESTWERTLSTSISHGSTVWAQEHLKELAVCTALTAGLLFVSSEGVCRLIPAAATLSAIVFWLLDRHHGELNPIHLRIAADAALLTPLLFVLVIP